MIEEITKGDWKGTTDNSSVTPTPVCSGKNCEVVTNDVYNRSIVKTVAEENTTDGYISPMFQVRMSSEKTL